MNTDLDSSDCSCYTICERPDGPCPLRAPEKNRRIDSEWDWTIDHIPDNAMVKLEDFIRKMKTTFEVKSINAHTNSVTCTISFDDAIGPEAQLDALERMFQAHGIIEAIFVNLRHEREVY